MQVRGKETDHMDAQQSLQMNGKQSRTIRLKISPQADFREVIRTLESILIPPFRVSDEHIRFAILELLNNSIRAHREKNEPREILVDLTVADGLLVVAIRDFGGGFDTKRLPYDLNEDPRSLDLHSSSFQEYQEKNGYKRFGMGIYVARKTFDEFRLVFFDERDRPIRYTPGATVGTLITLTVSMDAVESPSAQEGAAKREVAFGK
jgi:anti-sigma regulatory factor (Ser/Thr protein kinase)